MAERHRNTREINQTDEFSDEEELQSKGIKLPPTREDVGRLMTINNGKYKEELYLVHNSYNAARDENGTRLKIKYSEIEKILMSRFRLRKLRSEKGKPYTTSPGEYLARICGTREEQEERCDKLHKNVKSVLLSQSDLNIREVHVKISRAEAYTADVQTESPIVTNKRSQRQTKINDYMSPQTGAASNTSADQGYGTQTSGIPTDLPSTPTRPQDPCDN